MFRRSRRSESRMVSFNAARRPSAAGSSAVEASRMVQDTTALDWLIAATVALADQFPVMPIEEIQLSVALAELPNPEQVVPRLLAELVDHEDMRVRRVGIHACRRIGRFQLPGVREAISSRRLCTRI